MPPTLIQLISQFHRRAMSETQRLRANHAHTHPLVAAVSVGAGAITSALLALVHVQRGQLRELTLIRRHLTRSRIVSLKLSGRITPKEGSDDMPDIGIFKPSETEDVVFTTAVAWSGPPGTATLAWTLNNDAGTAGTLEVSADTLSAKLVTAPGAFSARVVVTAPNGVSDLATVTRDAAPASEVTAIGLGASVLPK